jgi:hypothetical protein
MPKSKTGFPTGAMVLIDGTVRARVLQHFPQGSSSYMFPHYKVDVIQGDRNIAVAETRVGVKRKRGARVVNPGPDFATYAAKAVPQRRRSTHLGTHETRKKS